MSVVLVMASVFEMQSETVFGQMASNSKVDSVKVEYFDGRTYCVTVIESIMTDINIIDSGTISPLSAKTETKSKM